jgi:microcin C transport system substrate-binding protein
LRIELDPARWAAGYDKALVEAGAIVLDSWTAGQPDEGFAFLMNTRKPQFADRNVRKALALAFDFDGANKTVGYGLMAPFTSFWQGSELAATGLPKGEELAILEKYKGRIPDEVFTTPFAPPRTPDEGALRQNLLEAQKLLAAAGYEIRDGALTHVKTGQTLAFEILLRVPTFEKWVGSYARNLERLGIKATMRIVDPTQYLNRVSEFDYEMTVAEQPYWGGMSNSPGNEQRENWGSAAADRQGSENWIGVKDPVVDEIVEALIKSETRESLVAHTNALDRVLMWGHYVVPTFSKPDLWWARSGKLARMDVTPLVGQMPALWWEDTERAAKVAEVLRDRNAPADAGGNNSKTLLMALAGVVGLVVLFMIFRRRRA